MASSFPARLHVLLARAAPRGLIVRRGPSKAVATIDWDRRRDAFTVGQWLRGRIYERRCDLSPDGAYFIYFAMNGHFGAASRGAWTAISRTPYLKALVMRPKGDCWQGGGLFTHGHRYWLNGGHDGGALAESGEVTRDPTYEPSGGVGAECLGVYYPRLLRDGWRRVASAGKGEDTFEKPLPGGWILRKRTHATTLPPPGAGCYWDEHEVASPDGDARIDGATWEWADLDGSRLVFATGGKLLAASLTHDGPGPASLLFDANPLRFEELTAPY